MKYDVIKGTLWVTMGVTISIVFQINGVRWVCGSWNGTLNNGANINVGTLRRESCFEHVMYFLWKIREWQPVHCFKIVFSFCKFINTYRKTTFWLHYM